MTWVVGLLSMLSVLQVPQASIVGVIRDASTGAPLSGVDVALTDLERRVVTDQLGRYEHSGVPAGPQYVSVGRIGYTSRTVHALVPGSGPLELNFSLPVDPIEVPAIAVRSSVPIRGLRAKEGSTPPDREISQAAMRIHPMLAEMDGFQALAGGEIVLDPEASTGVHIRGGRADQTAYVLDGVPVFNPYHAAGIFSAWNPDALSVLEVYSSAPSPSLPNALSGTISASTRNPGLEVRSQGSLTTGQARATIDGPFGDGGYLFSFRGGFPDAFAPSGEPEYIRGETGDHLAKIELPAFGGRLGLLSYESESELGTGLVGGLEPAASSGFSGNRFEWRSRSLGATWTRAFERLALRTHLWHASSDAASAWTAQGAPLDLEADRADQGLLVAAESLGDDRLELGIRLNDSRTSYRVAFGIEEGPFVLTSTTPVVSAFGSGLPIHHGRCED